MATFTELFEQLGPDDNVRGRKFERICSGERLCLNC
jgi:hypothetical protein